VLCVLIGVAAIMSFLKGKFGGAAKVALLVAAAVAIFLLKVFDAKFWGVVVMGGAVIILFFLPWLDHSPARSIRYRPGWHKILYGIFVVNMFVLGYLGIQPPSDIGTLVAQVGTLLGDLQRCATVGAAGRLRVLNSYSWLAHLSKIDSYLSP